MTSDRDGIKHDGEAVVSNVTAEGLPSELITAQLPLSGERPGVSTRPWTLSDVRVASEGATLSRGRPRQGGEQASSTRRSNCRSDFKAELAVRGQGHYALSLRRAIAPSSSCTAELNDLRPRADRLAQARLSATGSLDAAGAAEWRGKGKWAILQIITPCQLDGRFALDAAGRRNGSALPGAMGERRAAMSTTSP